MTEKRVKFRTDKSIRRRRHIRRRMWSYVWAVIVFLAVVAITTVLVSRLFFLKSHRSDAGEIAQSDVYAPFSFEALNNRKYEERLEKARQKSPRIYVYDSSVMRENLKSLRDIREFTLSLIPGEEGDTERLQEAIKRRHGLVLSDGLTTTLLKIGNDAEFYENIMPLIISDISRRGVIDDKYTFQTFAKKQKDETNETYDRVEIIYPHHEPEKSLQPELLIDYREDLDAEIRRWLANNLYRLSPLHAAHLSAIHELARKLIDINLKYSPELTEEKLDQILSRIRKIPDHYAEGELIVKEGETISQDQAVALKRLNTIFHRANFSRLPLNFFIVLIFCGFVIFFVHKYRPDMTFTASNIILISLPVLLALGLGRLVVQILSAQPLEAGYLFPAGVIGILTVVLLDARVGFLLVSIGAFLFGFMLPDETLSFRVSLVAFMGGITSVSSLYNVRERKEMLMAGFRIALVNFISIIIIQYIYEPVAGLRETTLIALWGLGNGIACALIAFPALSFFEVFFGVVTDVRLLELTGIRQKLLMDMEEKAPGSYQHSLNVAKLSEPAAIAVGVNYLLVRAGAYYHDVGKIVKPKYYSENQTTPEDKKIYQNITPHMAVLIIKKHIKEGIEMAKEAGLPQQVIDFIPQHHGTSLIRYFYNQALKRAEEGATNDVVREQDFRYPGPKPQTIETAIVMLADSVEAITTSELSKTYLDEDDIRRLVHTSVLTQFNDGQFDECNMTLRDLHKIEESFVKTLLSRYHHRVQYPEGKRSNNRRDSE